MHGLELVAEAEIDEFKRLCRRNADIDDKFALVAPGVGVVFKIAFCRKGALWPGASQYSLTEQPVQQDGGADLNRMAGDQIVRFEHHPAQRGFK